MRMMVILAVLLASLLAVTGVAFAFNSCSSCNDPECFKVTATDVDNSSLSDAEDIYICWDNYPYALLCDHGSLIVPLVFIPGLNDQAVGFSATEGTYMTFHGNYGAFNGILYNGTDRIKIHGVEEQCM
jgi:hypothetical protein